MRILLLAPALLTAVLLPACQNSQKIVIERVMGPPESEGFISTRLAYDSPLGKQLTKAAYDLGRLEARLRSLLGEVLLSDMPAQGTSKSAHEWTVVLQECIDGADSIRGAIPLRKECLSFFPKDNIYEHLPDVRGLLAGVSLYAFQVDEHLRALTRDAESWQKGRENEKERLAEIAEDARDAQDALAKSDVYGDGDLAKRQNAFQQWATDFDRWAPPGGVKTYGKTEDVVKGADLRLQKIAKESAKKKKEMDEVAGTLRRIAESQDAAKAARAQIEDALRSTVARGGFGGFRATDIYEISPSDPMYERVLNATQFRVMSSAEAHVAGDSGIMLVLEHAGQVRVYQVSSNPEQLVRNIGLIVSKATAAVAKYAAVGGAP